MLANKSYNVNGMFPTEVNYSGELKLTGNTFNLNYTTPLFEKTKLIASGKYSRIENDPISIDGPDWGGKSDSGFIFVDLDQTSLFSPLMDYSLLFIILKF